LIRENVASFFVHECFMPFFLLRFSVTLLSALPNFLYFNSRLLFLFTFIPFDASSFVSFRLSLFLHLFQGNHFSYELLKMLQFRDLLKNKHVHLRDKPT
jgi:hypothetical protein